MAAGLAFGLGAGVSPGPLLGLVITSTLQRGFGAGLRVAIAPLLTDAPIIAVAVLVVSSISDDVVRVIGIGGGAVVVGLGIWTVLSARRPFDDSQKDAGDAGDVWRGVIVNVMSPHPWVFWLTAGGPLLVSAWRRSPAVGVLFAAGFYLLLIGSKVMIAWAVERGSRRFSSAGLRRLIVIGGLALISGGILLAWQAAAGRL